MIISLIVSAWLLCGVYAWVEVQRRYGWWTLGYFEESIFLLAGMTIGPIAIYQLAYEAKAMTKVRTFTTGATRDQLERK